MPLDDSAFGSATTSAAVAGDHLHCRAIRQRLLPLGHIELRGDLFKEARRDGIDTARLDIPAVEGVGGDAHRDAVAPHHDAGHRRERPRQEGHECLLHHAEPPIRPLEGDRADQQRPPIRRNLPRVARYSCSVSTWRATCSVCARMSSS